MTTRRSLGALMLATILVGCQPVANTPTQPGPSSAPTASPTGSPLPGGTATIQGILTDDQGARVEGTVTLKRAGGSTASVPAVGGAYAFNGVPVGETVTVSVAAPEHSTRERTLTVARLTDPEADPNRLDFGGSTGGWPYALFRNPDILNVEATGPDASDTAFLRLTFHLSQDLDEAGHTAFMRIIELQAPNVLGDTTTATVDTSFLGLNSTLIWSDARTAVWRFTYPIAPASGGALTVTGAQTATVAAWPSGVTGDHMGRALLPRIYSPEGVMMTEPGIAAFFKVPAPSTNILAPADRNGDKLWAYTHQTGVRFSPPTSQTVPKVLSVKAFHANGSVPDRFVVTFDRPMRAFPDSITAPSLVAQDNYRWVTDKLDNPGDYQNDDAAFAAANPAKNGAIASNSVQFAGDSLTQVILPLAQDSFKGMANAKLYLSPEIADPYGVKLGSFDGTPGEAQNVYRMEVQ